MLVTAVWRGCRDLSAQSRYQFCHCLSFAPLVPFHRLHNGTADRGCVSDFAYLLKMLCGRYPKSHNDRQLRVLAYAFHQLAGLAGRLLSVVRTPVRETA